ncbi:MAG: class I SAM-dependent methyltransferase [Bacteroidetes bacterium]|nr:class I SAM-dependent methyltransferase [Bacteroidota bacterium]
MNKLKKLAKALLMILRRPWLLNRVIDDNDAWRNKVRKEFGSPEWLPVVDFRSLAGVDEIKVKPFAYLEGGSLPTDLALLRSLALKIPDCRYFEIGTWRGESVANVAGPDRECYTLDLSVGEMREKGLNDDYITQQGMFLKDLPNVIQLEGNSMNFDFAGLNKKFDLIFIDGDHHYSSIKNDTDKVFAHLVHEKSIVVWHDYAWQPGNIRFETMAGILAGIPENFRKNLYTVSNTLCAIYYPAGLEAQEPKPLAFPENIFEVRIKINN